MSSMNERFKETRKRLDFTQKEFAKALGISQTHISSIENGKDNPSVALLKLIAMKYNIDEEWLINGNGSPEKGWDISNDDGTIAKYEAMRAQFESKLRKRTGSDLVNMVEAFSYLDALFSAFKISEENQSAYIKCIRTVIDEMERMMFNCSMMGEGGKGVDSTSRRLHFQNEAERSLETIIRNLKEAGSLYIKQK